MHLVKRLGWDDAVNDINDTSSLSDTQYNILHTLSGLQESTIDNIEELNNELAAQVTASVNALHDKIGRLFG